MATILLVKECLLALKDRTGSSVPAINKWLESEKKVSVKNIGYLTLRQYNDSMKYSVVVPRKSGAVTFTTQLYKCDIVDSPSTK